jgi:hypothetical protein
MLQRRVSVCPALGQPLFSLILVGLSASLSLWLTLHFCRQLWPNEGGLVLSGIGLTWELAKIRFGAFGVRGLAEGPWTRRLAAAGLVAMTAVLVAGSVAASMAYFSKAETEDRGRQARDSRRYQEAAADLKALDAQLAILASAAAADAAQGFRRRALSTSDAISTLRLERTQAAERPADLESHPAGGADASDEPRPLGAGWATLAATKVVHLMVALMLELIGLAAGCMCSAARAEADQVLDASNAADAAASRRVVATVGAPSPLPEVASARYVEAREVVRRAEVQPTYRALQKALCVGQATARRFLAEMQAEGMLRRVGRRFELAA